MDEAAKLAVEKLDALAQAAGVQIAGFYPHVIREVWIEGLLNLVYAILLLSATLLLARHVHNKWSAWSENTAITWAIILIVVGITAMIAVPLTANTGITFLYNPEYYATRDIVFLLKP